MTVEVEVADPRHDPAPAGLAEFAAAADLPAFWSYDLLRVASWNSWTPSLVGVMRLDAEVVGVACGMQHVPHARRRFAPARGGLVPRVLNLRQPLNGYEASWRFRPGLPDADRAVLLAAFERAAMRRLGPHCLGVVYQLARAADLPALRHRRGPLPRPVRPSPGVAVMDVPWPDEDGWLRSLSASRRQDLRRQRRRLREDPDVVCHLGFGRSDVDTVAAARLLRDHHVRYAGRLRRAQPTPSYLDRFAARPDVCLITYTDATGRLLAMGTLLAVGRSRAIIGPWAALPPEHGGRRHLYFDMYCRATSWVTADGRRGVNAGTGMLGVKQDLGFAVEPLFTVYSPRWIT